MDATQQRCMRTNSHLIKIIYCLFYFMLTRFSHKNVIPYRVEITQTDINLCNNSTSPWFGPDLDSRATVWFILCFNFVFTAPAIKNSKCYWALSAFKHG